MNLTPQNERYNISSNTLGWTGVRPSEACALMRDCIDFSTGEITIKRSMGELAGHVKESTKTNRERVVYIIPEIEWTLKSATVPFVFMRARFGRATPYNTDRLQRLWLKACSRAKIKAGLYQGLRHSFASQRIGHGVDKVQKLLGHTSIKTTQRYLDYKDSLREVQRGKVVELGTGKAVKGQ